MTGRLRVSLSHLAREAVSALLAHRLRATLSVTGIICGVATVVTALAIGEGARRTALAEIGVLGINNVFVQATAAPPHDRRQLPPAPVLTLADARVVADSIQGHLAVAAVRIAQTTIIADGRQMSGSLAGVTTSWRETAGLELASGRWLSTSDDRSRRRVAVIGSGLARALFVGVDPIGARVRAGDTWFVIVGTLGDRRSGGPQPAIRSLDTDRALIVPLSAMDITLGAGDEPERVQEIAVRLARAEDVEPASQILAAAMKRRHGDAGAYALVVPRELLRARLRAQRAFDVVLLGIGALALVISGIGIMNIMLASVAERTQEIGIRRAFGARRAEVIAQFACEAAALCVAGGLVGVPLGGVLSAAVAIAAGWPVAVSLPAILLALTLATTVGLLAGLYPAKVAAEVAPIDALRAP